VEILGKRKVYVVVASGLALGLLLAFGQLGLAQVGISTFAINLEIRPGETATDSLYITNNGDSPRYVRIEAVDWVPTGPAAREYLPPGTVERSLTGWLTFWPSEVSVNPGEAVEIHVEVTPPDTVKGVYWGMLFLRLETQPVANEGTQAQIGMNVILAVEVYADTGEGNPEGRITNFSCKPIERDEQMLFMLTFENTGITQLHSTGTIQIRDESGDIAREIVLPVGTSLPGTTQTLGAPLTIVPSEGPGEMNTEDAEPQPPLPPGTYLAIAIIDYGGDALVAAQLPFEIQEESTD